MSDSLAAPWSKTERSSGSSEFKCLFQLIFFYSKINMKYVKHACKSTREAGIYILIWYLCGIYLIKQSNKCLRVVFAVIQI